MIEPTLNLKPRQRVAIKRLIGPNFEPDWSETATVIKGGANCVSETSGFWWPVRFDSGGELRVHEACLRPL